MKRFLCVVGGVSFVLGGAGCIENLSIPTPPMQSETQAIAASYDMPAGSLDVSNVQGTLDTINATIPNLALDWLPSYAEGLLSDLDSRIKDSGLPDNPDASRETHGFVLSAVVNVNRVCMGWDDPPGPPDAVQNGTIVLTAVVQSGRLVPESWGTATACKLTLTVLNGAITGNATLDGTVILYLLGPLPTGSSDARFLLTFNGTLTVGNQTLNSSIDFRVFDGVLAFRLPVTGGDIVVEVGTGSSVTLRGSNGTFLCDLKARSCQ